MPEQPAPPWGTDNICPSCRQPIETGPLPWHIHHGLSAIHDDCCTTDYPDGCP